jgi:hypothetical protein
MIRRLRVTKIYPGLCCLGRVFKVTRWSLFWKVVSIYSGLDNRQSPMSRNKFAGHVSGLLFITCSETQQNPTAASLMTWGDWVQREVNLQLQPATRITNRLSRSLSPRLHQQQSNAPATNSTAHGRPITSALTASVLSRKHIALSHRKNLWR